MSDDLERRGRIVDLLAVIEQQAERIEELEAALRAEQSVCNTWQDRTLHADARIEKLEAALAEKRSDSDTIAWYAAENAKFASRHQKMVILVEDMRKALGDSDE